MRSCDRLAVSISEAGPAMYRMGEKIMDPRWSNGLGRFFLFRRFRLRRQWTLATNLFVHLQEGPAQLLKLAELGNLTFSCRAPPQYGDGAV